MMINRLIFLILLLFAAPLAAQQSTAVMSSLGYSVIDKQRYQSGYLFNTAGHPRIHLVTLNWPPYVSEELCNFGWAMELAVTVLTHQGYQVFVEFLPWARAVSYAETGKADILFPEYFIEESAPSDIYPNLFRRELLALSEAIPGGKVGLFKRRGEDTRYDGTLMSLKDAQIGVVRSYQNTPEFDALMDSHYFRKLEVLDDLQLAHVLAEKRVNLIIGDPTVIHHAIDNASLPYTEKASLHESIEFIQPELRINDLYFALSKRKPDWHLLMEKINLSLTHLRQHGELQRIIDSPAVSCRLSEGP